MDDGRDALRKKSLVWMSDSLWWPNYPILPLRKPLDSKAVGFMAACDGSETTVYFENIFNLGSGTLRQVLARLEKKVYDSLQAIIDDGWEVD